MESVSDQDDDWLFESIRKYKSLYMYNLQKPVEAADWVTDESIVTCISNDSAHEILELSLPTHLSVKEANIGLTKDRDFQLACGGFSESCIASLHHIPNTRKVVATLKGDNSVETWQLKTADSNLAEKTGIVNNKVSTCYAAKLCMVDNTRVVFGSHLSSICVADLTTQSVISNMHDDVKDSPLSNMVQYDNCVLTSDRNSGQLFLVDHQAGVLRAQMSDPYFVCDASSTYTLCQETMQPVPQVIMMSTSGKIYVRDCRNLKQCVMTVQTNMTTERTRNIHISRCPDDRDLLAVTGFSGHVCLFDCSRWRDGSDATPVFVHDGHLAEKTDASQETITNIHLWYPWKHKTLLSASNDGGLHVFQPNL